jgi:hypothetical protein
VPTVPIWLNARKDYVFEIIELKGKSGIYIVKFGRSHVPRHQGIRKLSTTGGLYECFFEPTPVKSAKIKELTDPSTNVPRSPLRATLPLTRAGTFYMRFAYKRYFVFNSNITIVVVEPVTVERWEDY